MTPASRSDHSLPLAAFLSTVFPGLGQAVKHQFKRAAAFAFVWSSLLGALWATWRIAGPGAAIFFFLIIILPWWIIQAYDAFLPSSDVSPSLRKTIWIVLQRAHDIRFLGCLFLLTAVLDLYIIVVNPEYALMVFCARPGGVLGVLAKAQSPTLHVLIGVGFLRIRRWSLMLYLAYAAFGLLNATANYACFGFGRVRTVFFLSLLSFTAYVWWRRTAFHGNDGAQSGSGL
jgi:hypothetical protein